MPICSMTKTLRTNPLVRVHIRSRSSTSILPGSPR
jgi:hypothetical protein